MPAECHEWKDLFAKGHSETWAGTQGSGALKDQLDRAVASNPSIQNSLSSGQWPAGLQAAMYKG